MHNRFNYILLLVATLAMFNCQLASAQEEVAVDALNDGTPVILYSGEPKKYIIADIAVEGADNYEDNVIINISGLQVGETIEVPGEDITDAAKRYWKHGLFSDVSIQADKIVGDRIWLRIKVSMRPRVSEVNYYGLKKSEQEDLQARIGMIKGSQITPNAVSRAETIIKRYLDGKGFKNAEVKLVQRDDPDRTNEIIVDVNVDKKEKVKVHQITIEGNKALKTNKIKRVMKKTNEKNKLVNIFRAKKFVPEKYEEDKQLIIDKYNELGYRDAVILADSVTNFDDNTVDVYIKVEEGEKYYIRNISWVGNTVYPSDVLANVLQMKPGDVYNQKKLEERTITDDESVGNLYYNNGYLFYSLDPVEVNIVGDSVDLEMRIYEGQQATVNKVTITGNDRLYEEVVRRELYVKPGKLFSKDDIMTSMREIQQMGHFDPEQLQPDIQPRPEDGTVDIGFPLVSKPNDQVELSAGWGQTGVIGKLSLKFTNFSMKNLLHPSRKHRGLLPQGEGQTLTLSGQTNGSYYQSYSISFLDPWFGGKRPNAFQVSAYYYVQTDISSRYYNTAMMNMYNSAYGMGGMYGGYGGYGYGGYGYGGYGYSNYENYYDPDKYMKMIGASVMFGKRLSWPDNYFQISAELSFNRYMLSQWMYFPVTDGSSNEVALNFTLARRSTDNPIYTRQGSEFTFSVQLTPPWSSFDGKDYSKYDQSNQDDYNKMYRWIEYHKWKFKSKVFIPLADPYTVKRTPVLMARAEFGLLGHYNKYKKSPFQTFDVGGDGMTGYTTYATESVALRGYENSSLTMYRSQAGYAYTRFGLELRYPILLETSSTIYALAFLEGGNAWHDVSKFNPFDMKRSAGLGVRIYLPMIGMMGIDWGYGFDKVNGSTQFGGSNFHFVLGQEF